MSTRKRKPAKPRKALEVGGITIEPGRTDVEIPLGALPTQDVLSMRVEVVSGINPGPVVFMSAAIHGDELNGVEIVRRVVNRLNPDTLSGTVIAVPIVNVYSFIHESRYLPDRRDLNRSFPGRKTGSLAARLAYLFIEEIVKKADYGVDLHTAATGRYNLPQVRGDFTDPEVEKCARAFKPPVFFHSPGRKGTIRRAANELGVPVILYEGGEAGRFDREAIQIGVNGTLRMLAGLSMIGRGPRAGKSVEAEGTTWIRAKRSGLLRLRNETGDAVKRRQKLGTIGDALGDETVRVSSPCEGIIISHATNPLLNQGDAVVHIAKISPPAPKKGKKPPAKPATKAAEPAEDPDP